MALLSQSTEPGPPTPVGAGGDVDGGRAPTRALSWRVGVIIVAAGFVASRVVLNLAGVQFDPRPLDDGFQLLELAQLRDDLFGSLAHLHSQPPLFNLAIGLGLRAPSSLEVPLFHLAYVALGLGLAMCLYAVLRRLGASGGVAVAVTLVFSVSPSVFLFENWLHYDYPVTLLLLTAVLALQRYEDRHRLGDAAMFLGLLAALALTRSLFHLLWLVAWAVVLVVHRRRADWRKVVTIAAVPVVAVVVVYANILAVAGTFGSSTSMGISLAKITTFQIPPGEREALAASGELSPLALVDPLSPVASYRGVIPTPAPTGVDVLDDEVKDAADGSTRVNYNNLLYAEASARYMEDVSRSLRLNPRAYLRGMATAYGIYFRPSSDFFNLVENRQRLSRYVRLYDLAVYGVVQGGQANTSFPDAAVQYRQGPGRTAWLVVAGYAVALVGGAWWLWRDRRDRPRSPLGPPPLVLAFLWSTVVYVTVVANSLEVGENERFRLYTEPLVVALLVALAAGWHRRRRSISDEPGSQGPKARLPR